MLFGVPNEPDNLARLFTLSRADLTLVAERRGPANQIGFAVQLALLRHPGIALANLEQPPEPLVLWLARQLDIPAAAFARYASRPQTMTDHARHLARVLQLRADRRRPAGDDRDGGAHCIGHRSRPRHCRRGDRHAAHGRRHPAAGGDDRARRDRRACPGPQAGESPQLRQRCQAGLNKSEQRHALAQVICTVRQGRIADRGQDAQQFRASGLNLVIAAIAYWNSTYIADAMAHLRHQGEPVSDELLAHTSPLTWEHIGFSGDFLWDRAAATADRRRSLNLGRLGTAA